MKTTQLIFILAFICGVISKSWYVSQIRGDDNNDGTTTRPFLTFQKAYEALFEGDTVNVEIGAYGIRSMTNLNKTFHLSGQIQGGRLPLFVGNLDFTSKMVSIENIHFESKLTHSISSVSADTVILKKLIFQPVRGEQNKKNLTHR
jgi:hypothetical protein